MCVCMYICVYIYIYIYMYGPQGAHGAAQRAAPARYYITNDRLITIIYIYICIYV